MSLSVQNSTNIALDEKIRGYWLIRTSAKTEQEIASIRIVTEGTTRLSAVKRAIQQTIVSRRREVRDDGREKKDRARDKTGSPGDNFHTLSDGEESESETEQDLCYGTDDKDGYEATIALREARKSLRHGTTSRRFHKRGDNGRERVTSNRSVSTQVLEKVTTCNRCGALGHWEDECP